jgi:hypothetical protein
MLAYTYIDELVVARGLDFSPKPRLPPDPRWQLLAMIVSGDRLSFCHVLFKYGASNVSPEMADTL